MLTEDALHEINHHMHKKTAKPISAPQKAAPKPDDVKKIVTVHMTIAEHERMTADIKRLYGSKLSAPPSASGYAKNAILRFGRLAKLAELVADAMDAGIAIQDPSELMREAGLLEGGTEK